MWTMSSFSLEVSLDRELGSGVSTGGWGVSLSLSLELGVLCMLRMLSREVAVGGKCWAPDRESRGSVGGVWMGVLDCLEGAVVASATAVSL